MVALGLGHDGLHRCTSMGKPRLRPAIVTGNHIRRQSVEREIFRFFRCRSWSAWLGPWAMIPMAGLGSSFAFAHRDGGRRPGGAAGAGEKVVGGQQTATLRRACIEVILR